MRLTFTYNAPESWKAVRRDLDDLRKFFMFYPQTKDVINTTGLTSAQVDAKFASVPPVGFVIWDDTNSLLLIRGGAGWRKISTVAV